MASLCLEKKHSRLHCLLWPQAGLLICDVGSLGDVNGNLTFLFKQSEKTLRPRGQLKIEGRRLACSRQGAGWFQSVTQVSPLGTGTSVHSGGLPGPPHLPQSTAAQLSRGLPSSGPALGLADRWFSILRPSSATSTHRCLEKASHEPGVTTLIIFNLCATQSFLEGAMNIKTIILTSWQQNRHSSLMVTPVSQHKADLAWRQAQTWSGSVFLQFRFKGRALPRVKNTVIWRWAFIWQQTVSPRTPSSCRSWRLRKVRWWRGWEYDHSIT